MTFNRSSTHKSIGILENNKIYIGNPGQQFTVPTDWQVILNYNPEMMGGTVSIEATIEEMTEWDEVRILNNWQPTTTYF